MCVLRPSSISFGGRRQKLAGQWCRLIKRFPPKAHAAAHCIAGGMASVATSFVYTPAECIKQRVQIGLYPHAWSALKNTIQNEGFLKL